MSFEMISKNELIAKLFAQMFDHDDEYVYCAFDNANDVSQCAYECASHGIEYAFASNIDNIAEHEFVTHAPLVYAQLRVRANIERDDDGGEITF